MILFPLNRDAELYFLYCCSVFWIYFKRFNLEIVFLMWAQVVQRPRITRSSRSYSTLSLVVVFHEEKNEAFFPELTKNVSIRSQWPFISVLPSHICSLLQVHVSLCLLCEREGTQGKKMRSRLQTTENKQSALHPMLRWQMVTMATLPHSNICLRNRTLLSLLSCWLVF